MSCDRYHCPRPEFGQPCPFGRDCPSLRLSSRPRRPRRSVGQLLINAVLVLIGLYVLLSAIVFLFVIAGAVVAP